MKVLARAIVKAAVKVEAVAAEVVAAVGIAMDARMVKNVASAVTPALPARQAPRLLKLKLG